LVFHEIRGKQLIYHGEITLAEANQDEAAKPFHVQFLLGYAGTADIQGRHADPPY
jgi:hypothetical protein